jgi:hypothetical protein
MTVGPGHARTGTQIAWVGTTPGGYLGGQLGCRPLGGYRAPYLKSAATVRDANRDSPSRLEPPWRAYRRQPGEMDGIGAIDPDPGANTPDR